MAAYNGAGFSELFEQALGAFSGAVKAGVRFQEDAAKFWTGAATAHPVAATYQDFQKRSQTLWSEAGPATRKQMDEYLKLFDASYSAGLELMKKAMCTGRSESVAEAQEKVDKLVDESMELIRNNAKTMAETNVRVYQEWADLVRKGVQSATDAAVAAQAQVKEAARPAAAAASKA